MAKRDTKVEVTLQNFSCIERAVSMTVTAAAAAADEGGEAPDKCLVHLSAWSSGLLDWFFLPFPLSPPPDPLDCPGPSDA